MDSFTLRGEGWSHEVLIGDIAGAAASLDGLCKGQRVPLVTDRNVLTLHGQAIANIAHFQPIEVQAGEEAKSWDTLQGLTRRFAQLGVSRQTPIIAFGGGSIGDVAGLAAALFKRGCPIVHIPTTLLSQVDSAIGGKTAIDDCGQKNLVGAFHPPALVVCDPSFLDTLDERQLRAGYAEVVKYGLIDDPGFFDWCERNGAALLKGSRGARLHAIGHCLRAKARFVCDDLRDLKGRRALLNLGHSFGHAIESVAGIGNVLHGEAVAVGMCLAFDFSRELGFCPAVDADRLRSHLRSVGLPIGLDDLGLAETGPALLSHMLQDKKATASGPALILVRGTGQAFLARHIDADRLLAFLSGAD